MTMNDVPQRTLMLSVKPRFAEAILQGRKTIELRRRCPRVESGMPIILYATAPRMALVGKALVRSVASDWPGALWNRVKDLAEVSRKEYRDYFAGATLAYGIELTAAERLASEIPLAQLRQSIAGFHPPQSFRYLAATQLSLLLGH